VYVQSNIGCAGNNQNSVFGFSNSGGVLTALPNSPYLTNGTGVCDNGQVKGKSEFDADQQVIITKNNVLYAVNGHSNTFAGFAINTTTGDLTPLPGSPFKSNGSDPVSFGYLYNIYTGPESWLGVVNKGADPNQTDGSPNISAFKVNTSGVPVLVTKATLTLPAGSSPSQLLTTVGSTAKKQFWAFLDQYQTSGSNLAGVYSYQVAGNAGLMPINFAGDPTDPPTLGMALNPVYRVLYAGLPTLNEVGVFLYNVSTGSVSFNNAFPNPGESVGWMVVGPPGTGHFLYTADPTSGTITVYQLTFNGTNLTQVQNFTLSGTSPMPGNLAFDPTGAYLYCLDNVHSTLHVLTVSATTGKLSEPNAATVLNEGTTEEALGLATVSY
jgi:6-phosphogluconolactonase (cycloisomerase 2 family)